MPTLTAESARAIVEAYRDPWLGTTLGEAKAVQAVHVDGGQARIEIELGMPTARYGAELAAALGAELQRLDGLVGANIAVRQRIVAHAVQKGVRTLPEVRNIIAVASGKGGVGKSTVSANLALALAAEGARVGLLDADIYGPSQTRMLGCPGRPESSDGQSLEPRQAYGLQAMSIGNLVDEETPMIWRGPMVTSALEQMLTQTRWKDLDYLLVDLPPGTGDIQLTLCQKIPVSGAVIVTTPQDIALLDARRGLLMFQKVEVPVLGIVENMSTHICSRCGHEEHIFGSGGGAEMAAQYGVPLLGSLPLDASIREAVDNGRPTVAVDPDSAVARAFLHIARRVAAGLARRARDWSGRFPNIVVQNT